MSQPFRVLNRFQKPGSNNALDKTAAMRGFLTPAECDAVIALARNTPMEKGGTTPTGEDMRGRDSLVCFIQPDEKTEWIFARLEQALLKVNEFFRFELHGFYEGFQLARYEPGGHYDWHMDIGEEYLSARKLSMSVQLSDPADYEGGEIKFFARAEPAPVERGSLIVFPSYLPHTVRAVTRGCRYSLVSWISGPPFR
ncbi:MAG: 2OG-Fe(II) oxygenase [Gammaproteobacteria bacterium]|jgi:PKHD-type hydroxylase